MGSILLALATATGGGAVIPLTGKAAAGEHALAADQADTFAVRLQRGGRLEAIVDQRGMDVAIHVFDPSGREIAVIDSPNGANGPERVELDAPATGLFKLVVKPLDPKAPPGRYAVTAARVLSPAAEAARLAALRAQEAAVHNWLAARAIELGDDDRAVGAALAPALQGVDILGLGEGSHGSHELFDLKARIVRALVQAQGFRVLAMELDRVACEQLDKYVHGRTTEIDPRLKPWDTEEFIALLDWLRDWNRHATPADQVSVIGIDGQDRVSGADTLVDYLRRAAPERVQAADALTAEKTFPAKLDAEAQRRTQQGYLDLLIFFDLHATQLIVRSSRAEYDAMQELVQVMAQTGSIYGNDSPAAEVARRNEYMADNLRRYLDRAGAGTKVIVWAHNGHVETTPGVNPPTGYYLRQLYGRNYYALDATFAEGEYQAWTSNSPTFALGVHRAAELPPTAIERHLASLDDGPFFIDLRSGPRPSSVAQWLASAHPFRSIGAMYGPNSDRYTISNLVPAESADGFMFVRRSTRARPTPRMRAKYGEVPPAAPSIGANAPH